MANSHNVTKSVECFHEAIAIFEQKNDLQSIRNIYQLMGLMYGENHDYENALGNFEKILEMSEQNPDANRIGEIYRHIGNIYRQKGDVGKAVYYHYKALKAEEKNTDRSHDKFSIAYVYNVLTQDYVKLGNFRKAKECSYAFLGNYEGRCPWIIPIFILSRLRSVKCICCLHG